MVETRSTASAEIAALDGQELVVMRWNDAGVIGEGAVDQLRREHDRAQGEADFRRRKLDADLHFRVFDQFLNFGDRLARHDDARHARRARRGRRLEPSQPVPVGRDRAQQRLAVGLRDMHIHAVEVITGLLVGDGELRLIDQALQVAGRELEPVAQLARRKIGKIAFRQRLQVEARTSRAQLQLAVVVACLQRNLGAFRKLAHDFIERVRRQGSGAGLADIGGNRFCDFEIEIGRLELQAGAAGAQKDIGEDRNRRAPLDDAMDVTERFKQSRSLKRNFHGAAIRIDDIRFAGAQLCSGLARKARRCAPIARSFGKFSPPCGHLANERRRSAIVAPGAEARARREIS